MTHDMARDMAVVISSILRSSPVMMTFAICRSGRYRLPALLSVTLATSLASLLACPSAGMAARELPRFVPRPVAAVRPNGHAGSQAHRLRLINAARSWGYQLSSLNVAQAARSPFDLLVIDGTTGLAGNRPLTRAQIQSLKRKPDGKRRLVISYLSIGEAEDYRTDYFAKEYLTEDAPDWLMAENPHWKGNRIIRFCEEGWQKTILGDRYGHNVYNSIELSPLDRLIELGFDGVYLDRVDVYSEVGRQCPDAENRMVDFVARLASHARRRNSNFIVMLQNAEELLVHAKMRRAIDAVAKEDLFYGNDYSQRRNSADDIANSIQYLKKAKHAGRPVFVVDYVKSRRKIRAAKRLIKANGFIPYIGPRDLNRLWLPGRNF